MCMLGSRRELAQQSWLGVGRGRDRRRVPTALHGPLMGLDLTHPPARAPQQEASLGYKASSHWSWVATAHEAHHRVGTREDAPAHSRLLQEAAPWNKTTKPF